jgi:hypothetical protein
MLILQRKSVTSTTRETAAVAVTAQRITAGYKLLY